MFRRFAASTEGAVLVLTAIVLSVLIASTALGVEVGGWYLTTRQMQGASDASAISAAASYVGGEPGYQSVGYSYASKNGFCDKGQVSPCDPNSISNNVTVIVSPVTNNQIRVDIWDARQPWFVPAVWKLANYTCGNDTTDQYSCLHVHSIVSLHAAPSSGNNGCLLGLSKTQTALIVSGNGDINAPLCVAASDTCPGAGPGTSSCNQPGLVLNGANAAIDIAELDVATANPYSCGSDLLCQITTEKTTSPLWTLDPFANSVMPSPGSCTQNPKADSRGVTIYQPGTYCSGISISAHDNVIFEPGNYFLLNSSFSVTGGAINQCTVASATMVAGTGYKNNDTVTVVGGTTASAVGAATLKIKITGKTTTVTVTNAGAYVDSSSTGCNLPAGLTNPVTVTGGSGTGGQFNLTFDQPDPATNAVTFILTGTSVGTVQIKNAQVALTAPTTGSTANLLFWQDRSATAGGGTFNGTGVSLSLTGTLYFPSQTVLIAGSLTFGQTECTSIVANIIDFQGNGTLKKGCLPVGSTGGGGSSGTYTLSE